MSWITPFINWIASSAPKPNDFNRIESNTLDLNDRIIAEIADRVAAVLSEKNQRIAADSLLQSNITAEASTRSSADSALQTRLSNEISARSTAVSTEASTRSGADSTLQANINSETASRISADNTLQGNITAEQNARISAVATEHDARNNADIAEADARSNADSEILLNIPLIQYNASPSEYGAFMDFRSPGTWYPYQGSTIYSKYGCIQFDRDAGTFQSSCPPIGTARTIPSTGGWLFCWGIV